MSSERLKNRNNSRNRTGIVLLLYNLGKALFKGEKAGRNPWSGATLEWQIATPPPLENFEEIPTVTKDPYDFRGVTVS